MEARPRPPACRPGCACAVPHARPGGPTAADQRVGPGALGEVMGGGGGLGRLPADRLGRAASMEASGAVAAAANSGSGAAPASHAASPEGLVDEAWFFSLIDFCLLAPQLNFVLWFPFFPYP